MKKESKKEIITYNVKNIPSCDYDRIEISKYFPVSKITITNNSNIPVLIIPDPFGREQLTDWFQGIEIGEIERLYPNKSIEKIINTYPYCESIDYENVIFISRLYYGKSIESEYLGLEAIGKIKIELNELTVSKDEEKCEYSLDAKNGKITITEKNK